MNILSWTSENPFLQGAYAPVFDERDDVNLPIEGEIPRSLNGVFMRNGPNPQFQPERYVYPFDGTGMIHAVYLEDGRAQYRNRWVLTRELQEERAAGRRIYGASFGPQPHANLANTNIIRHGGRYLALYEAGAPYEMDRELNTLGIYDYAGTLPGAMSAHPKIDPQTQELLAVAYDIRTATLTYLAADSQGRLQKVIPFGAPWPAMVHDIAFTENYVIAFVCPFVIAPPKPAWEPERGTAIALIPRHGESQKVRWLRTAPFFHFHTLNAFEDGNCIEVQLPLFSSYSLRPEKSRRLELHTIRLDHETGTVNDQAVDDRACEFPRLNDRRAGKQNRYGYVAFRHPRHGEEPQMGLFEAIACYDFRTGTKTVHTFPAGQFVGEPVFVADPGRTEENAGFIFSFVYDASMDGSSLVILDAGDLAAPPLAVIGLPRRVPAGLHASWMPQEW